MPLVNKSQYSNEIVLPNSSNVIIDCKYKHPMLHIGHFNSNYISPLLCNLSNKSSKQIFSLGDFNIDLLKYDSSELVYSFLDTLYSNFLSLQIILPPRISFSSTLIDNIFCNVIYTTKSISPNPTSTVLDPLTQFPILPEFFCNAPP